MISRRFFTLGLIAMATLTNAQMYFEDDGLAIKGYDPVSYFTMQKPIMGNAEFKAQWGGATWQFASEENKNMFISNPEKYAPQYGGYCAYAVARGYTAATDPEAWTIHDGKLYLNYSTSVRATWSKDIPGNVTKADSNWPNLK